MSFSIWNERCWGQNVFCNPTSCELTKNACELPAGHYNIWQYGAKTKQWNWATAKINKQMHIYLESIAFLTKSCVIPPLLAYEWVKEDRHPPPRRPPLAWMFSFVSGGRKGFFGNAQCVLKIRAWKYSGWSHLHEVTGRLGRKPEAVTVISFFFF